MIRFYLLIIVLVLVFFCMRKFIKTPPVVIAGFLRKLAFLLLLLAVLYLAATGRLNWLFALVGVAAAMLTRFLPVLLRYAPHLQRLWMLFQQNKQQSTHNPGAGQGRSAVGDMNVTEAYQILGLKPGVSKQEIIMAHKRLIQKNHPDRGGSDYLAARINLAKETLLKSSR